MLTQIKIIVNTNYCRCFNPFVTCEYRPVTRILCGGGGGGGGAKKAKVDQTTEMYFYCLIRLFREVAIHEKLQRNDKVHRRNEYYIFRIKLFELSYKRLIYDVK